MPSDASLLQTSPLIAVLRGLSPERALETAQALCDSGFRIIEVPLNSPHPLVSIQTIATNFGDSCLCGAGTVLTSEEVRQARNAGAKLIVAPNFAPAVVECALALNLVVMPGIATPTEAFAARHAGARHLKLFPASSYGPAHLQALLAVLPLDSRIYAVGGIGPTQISPWLKSGASGFAFGSELFKPSYPLPEIVSRARSIVAAYQEAQGSKAARVN